MKIKFSFKNLLLASNFLLLGSLCCSSEPDAPLRSGVAVADDGRVLVRGGTSSLRPPRGGDGTILKVPPRVLKKKKKQKVPKAAKPPKGGKKVKSAVTPQPSSQSSSQPSSSQPSSSQPTEVCATINNQKDALLALKEGLINNDASKLTDWVTTTDPCTGAWTGITCDGRSDVTGIDVCE